MPDDFYLFAPFRNAVPVRISREEFAELKAAREAIVRLLEFEECYDLFARSFLRLEETLHDITQKFLFPDSQNQNTTELFGDARERLNLELISFLTASAVLIEKGDRLAKNGVVPGFDKDTFEPIRTKLFDDHFEYRVMCGLRNFALHNKLPLGSISLDRKLEFENDAQAPDGLSRQRHSCNPTFLTADLISDNSLRSETRKEIEGIGVEGLDVKFFVRRFVELLATRQFHIREMTDAGCKSSVAQFQDSVSKLSDKNNKEIEVIAVSTNGKPKELLGPFVIHVSRLTDSLSKRTKWQSLRNAVGSYVSGEIVDRASVYTVNPAAHFFPR